MSDDPNKRHVDSWFVSSQPHEYAYFKSAIQQANPTKSASDIEAAILACRKSIAPSEGRAKLAECVNRRLRGY